jgi:chemotaxis protein CheD
MSKTIVGIGGLAATNTPGDSIRTLALGSCIAVVLLHPRTRTVGMVHIALANSSTNKKRSEIKPGSFVDTGIPALLKEMQKYGCDSNIKSFKIKIAGGASVLDPNNVFNIGKNNLIAAKNLLWSLGTGAVSEDTGGNISRNVEVEVDTGKVTISSAGRGSWEI